MDLEKIAKFYGMLFETKEEMFLLGYYMACGGESILWNEIENDMELIERDPEFWTPIVKDILRIRKRAFNEKVKEVRGLLREKLVLRGIKIPKWLED